MVGRLHLTGAYATGGCNLRLSTLVTNLSNIVDLTVLLLLTFGFALVLGLILAIAFAAVNDAL